MSQLTSQSYVKIVLLILLGVVIVGAAFFSSCSGFRIGFGNSNFTETGNAQIEASGIKDINLDWAAGSVDFTINEGNDIILTESSSGSFSRAQEMRWKVSGSTLSIDYGNGFSCMNFAQKHLEISIPKSLADNLGKIKIEGASGEYFLQGLACEELRLGLASGRINAYDMEVGDLNIDNASGEIIVTGNVSGEIKTDTASGSINIESEKEMPESINSSLASGNISISIPENDGFTVDLDKLSGNFHSDFSTQQNGSRHVYKDGSTDIRIDIVSGNFTLQKS